MNSIPLLRLPLLVFQTVLSIMNPFELIHLAMVSNRTKQILKVILNAKLHKKYRSLIFIRNNYGIGIKNGKNSWYYMYTSRRKKVNYGRFISTADYLLEKYTYTKLEDFKNLFECCQEIFGNIAEIDLNMDNAENFLIIDYLKTKQESFETCHVRSCIERGDEVKHLIDNLNITKNLFIAASIAEDSEISLPENVENLLCTNSEFIKLEQVLVLKSKSFILDSTKFTNQDISVFLKSWIASESNLNVKRLTIVFDSTTTDNILQDIPNEIGDGFQFEQRYGSLISVPRGPDIKRDDGRKARVIIPIRLGFSTLVMYVH